MLKHSTKPEVKVAQPSVTQPVKIKDEPLDEEYEKASAPQHPIDNIKDEPDTAAVSFNIVFCLFYMRSDSAFGGSASFTPCIDAPWVIWWRGQAKHIAAYTWLNA